MLFRSFAESFDPERLWIGEIIREGDDVYSNWLKKTQSLSYTFKEQSEEMLSEYKLNELFDCSKYLGIDIAPGPGVDLVCDAASWEPDDKYDLALCAEVFEHTRDWSLICLTAFKSLKKGGTFLGSCASTGRLPHSAVDGGTLREGEYYSNVSKNDMHLTLESQGWSEVETFYNQECSDLYFKAIK